jgi:hypothetical protein
VLPASGTAGGLHLSVKEDFWVVSHISLLDFSLNCMVQNKKDGFVWKLVLVYGSPYEDKNVAFIDELHLLLEGWQGPIMVRGISTYVGFVLIRVIVKLIKNIQITLMIGLKSGG